MNTIKSLLIAICMSLMVMGLLFIAPSFAEISLDSIVGAWLFDEGEGNVAIDSSGNGYDGDIKGGAEYVAGQFGQALRLDGTDDWVEVPELGSFNEVTIAEWVNMTGRVGQWRVIFTTDGWSAGWVHHQFYSNNVIGFSIHSNPGGNDMKSDYTLDDSQLNVWHHLATVYNGNEGWIRFYVDGQLDVERAWGTNPAVLGEGRIGSWDGGGREWQGIFDEFIILNVAIDEGDVQKLMNDGLMTVIASVEPAGKIATVWGNIKVQY